MPGDAFPGDADGDGEHLQHDAGPTEGEDEGAKPRSPKGILSSVNLKHDKLLFCGPIINAGTVPDVENQHYFLL